MSRVASRPAGVVARPGFQDDICPVCKSSRYLNKGMRFLVNPECYHKMCESCVDRIFSHGPNKCPIAGCKRTLRKHRFREQTFEDIQVEREVDIRKRIAAIFNRREDEFEDLRAYNDYLNDVEDITFNLINNLEIEATERKLQAYSSDNSAAISENAAMASNASQNYAALQAAEREHARLRREQIKREEDEERRERVEGRQNVLNRLATGTGDAKEIAAEEEKIKLKKRLDRSQLAEKQRALLASDKANGSSGIVVRGLKDRNAMASKGEEVFDAFGGLDLKHEYYALADQYEWQWLTDLANDPVIAAGGYDVREFNARALCEAFSGLGVMIGDETSALSDMGDPKASAALGTVSAARAGTGAKDIKMEDPF